jgi:hypothetical protein
VEAARAWAPAIPERLAAAVAGVGAAMAPRLARAVDQAAPVQVRARDCLVVQAPAVAVADTVDEFPRDQRLTTTTSLAVAFAVVFPDEARPAEAAPLETLA